MDRVILYHGTDARIIEMTELERKQYLDDCNLVIDSLHPLFKPLLEWEKTEKFVNGEKIYVYEYPLKTRYEKILNEKCGKYGYINLFEKLSMINARKEGISGRRREKRLCGAVYGPARLGFHVGNPFIAPQRTFTCCSLCLHQRHRHKNTEKVNSRPPRFSVRRYTFLHAPHRRQSEPSMRPDRDR